MDFVHRFRRSPVSPVAPITVTLYGREGCHLCELAEKPVSRAVAATRGAVLRHVDIDTDDALRARYGVRIPVVTATVAGEERVIAEGKVSDIRLRRALAALRTER
jgi:hypothetical protein